MFRPVLNGWVVKMRDKSEKKRREKRGIVCVCVGGGGGSKAFFISPWACFSYAQSLLDKTK